MGYQFIGEGSPELKMVPKEQRRSLFLKAVRRSYGRLSTWGGFLFFLVLAGGSRHWAEALYPKVHEIVMNEERAVMLMHVALGGLAWIILGSTQLNVIRAELRKRISQQGCSTVSSEGAPSKEP